MSRNLCLLFCFCNAAPEEKDYAVLGSFAPQRALGKCVYCNRRCPFYVDQMARMQEIAAYFCEQ